MTPEQLTAALQDKGIATENPILTARPEHTCQVNGTEGDLFDQMPQAPDMGKAFETANPGEDMLALIKNEPTPTEPGNDFS